MKKDNKWRFSVVGNIVKTHKDDNSITRYGTKAFSGGTKVYLCGKYWDWNDKEIDVIGINRFGKYVYEKNIPIELIENIRFQIARKPSVLNIMDYLESSDGIPWWGRTSADKKEAKALADYLSKTDDTPDREILELLCKAFCGEIDLSALRRKMSEDCSYHSDYSGKMIEGRNAIIDRMNCVLNNIKKDNSLYYYRIVEPSEVLAEGKSIDECYVQHYCARLFQYDEESLAAIVLIKLNDNNELCHIELSRDCDLFKEEFYIFEELYPVSSLDVPSVIKEENIEEDIFRWPQADGFICSFFRRNNYYVEERYFGDEFIAYRCIKDGKNFVVYMFAHGKEEDFFPGTESVAEKLLSLSFSKDSTVLLADVISEKRSRGKEFEYVTYCAGHAEDDSKVYFWEAIRTDIKSIISNYPSYGLMILMDKFVWSFNNESFDAFESILTLRNPIFETPNGSYLNSACYSSLKCYHEEHGNLRIGYGSFDKEKYFKAPYIKNVGYFVIRVTDNRIDQIQLYSFDDSNLKDFIEADDVNKECTFGEIPSLEYIEDMSEENDMYKMLMRFSNGEYRLFELKVNQIDVTNTPLGGQYQFDPIIWHDAEIVESRQAPGLLALRSEECNLGQGVCFSNGCSISTIRLYEESLAYPQRGTQIVNLYERDHLFNPGEEENGIMIGTINGAKDYYLIDLKTMTARIIPEEYQETPIILYPFCGGLFEGLIMVSTINTPRLKYHHNHYSCAGIWGWIDTNFNVVIEPKYIFAQHFEHGRAIVALGDWKIVEEGEDARLWCDTEMWGVIDINEKEIVPCIYDELCEIDDTDRYYLVHKGGWEYGNYCVFDALNKCESFDVDFDYDSGYMFNENFFTEDEMIVFVEHQPGEGIDLISVYDLKAECWTIHREEWSGRTYNGKSIMTVERDGEEIIIF